MHSKLLPYPSPPLWRTVTSALVDEGLTTEEREALAQAIHSTPRAVEPRMGKPELPVVVWQLISDPIPPSLASMVTEHFWAGTTGAQCNYISII